MLAWTPLQVTYLILLSKEQLQLFGVKEHHLSFALGLAGAAACFYMLKPLLKLLIILRWETVLTYLVSNLLFLVLLGTLLISDNHTAIFLDGEGFAFVVLAIIFFGGGLSILHMTRFLVSTVRRRKSKAS